MNTHFTKTSPLIYMNIFHICVHSGVIVYENNLFFCVLMYCTSYTCLIQHPGHFSPFKYSSEIENKERSNITSTSSLVLSPKYNESGLVKRAYRTGWIYCDRLILGRVQTLGWRESIFNEYHNTAKCKGYEEVHVDCIPVTMKFPKTRTKLKFYTFVIQCFPPNGSR